MSDQPNLFETPKEAGYPIIMVGKWHGYIAYALVSSSKKQKELEVQGYVVTDYKEIPIALESEE